MKTFIACLVTFLFVLTGCSMMAHRQPASLVLTLNGLSPFSASTPFDVQKIRTLLPQYQVQILQVHTRREQAQKIEIRSHDRLLATLYTSIGNQHIFSATIHSNKIIKEPRLGLGRRFDALLGVDQATCLPGLGRFLNKVICEVPGDSRLLYIFTGKNPIVDDELPPKKALNDWRVEKIIWLPSAPLKINDQQ